MTLNDRMEPVSPAIIVVGFRIKKPEFAPGISGTGCHVLFITDFLGYYTPVTKMAPKMTYLSPQATIQTPSHE